MNRKKIQTQLKKNYLYDFLIWLGAVMILVGMELLAGQSADVLTLVILVIFYALPGGILFAILYAVRAHRVFDHPLPRLDDSPFTSLTADLQMNNDYLVFYQNLHYQFVNRRNVTDVSSTEGDGKAQAIFTLTLNNDRPFSYIYTPARTPDLYETLKEWSQLHNTCPVCGSENPVDALFCGTCGARLEEEPLPSDPGRPDESYKAVIAALVIIFLLLMLFRVQFGL